MDKEYFRIYYLNHKAEYKKRDKKWRKDHPEEAKVISKRSRENNPRKTRIRGTDGPPIKEIKLKPFKKRISPELLAKIKENTKINNKHIKFFTINETKENFLARNIKRDLRLIKK